MKRILVVDDEYAIVEALEALLTDEGYEVVVAGNGREALLRVRERAPQLILIDDMMPLMGGRETIAALRSEPAFDGVPVILMSAARVEPPPHLRIYRFLRKPFSLQTLLDSIETALRVAAVGTCSGGLPLTGEDDPGDEPERGGGGG